MKGYHFPHFQKIPVCFPYRKECICNISCSFEIQLCSELLNIASLEITQSPQEIDVPGASPACKFLHVLGGHTLRELEVNLRRGY